MSLKNEISEDFAEVCSDFGETLALIPSGVVFSATLSPMDSEREIELGGFADKENLEATVSTANGFALPQVGQRVTHGAKTFRVAKVEKDYSFRLAKLFLTEA